MRRGDCLIELRRFRRIRDSSFGAFNYDRRASPRRTENVPPPHPPFGDEISHRLKKKLFLRPDRRTPSPLVHSSCDPPPVPFTCCCYKSYMLQLSIVKFTIFSYYRVITVQSPLGLVVTQRAVIVIASVLTLCCYARVCKKFRITTNNNAIKSINAV